MSETLSRKLQQLAQAITHFDAQATRPLPAFFSPVLFPDDPQTVGEAQHYMAQTLAALKHAHDAQAAQFYAEKLAGQYHALTAALKTASTPSSPTTPAQRDNDYQQLPPRERLALYYGFLARLKTMLETQHNAQLSDKSAVLARQIEHTQTRIARCQAAIDHLEDYLAFVKRREEKKSAV
ncbi:primosomal replication protein PriC [Spirabiliibacterium falconis]|uniref:primosomal replication protein PriC n=1 Tax=Spirabiliibacterium falconis TaxID=572023 RepID=UPI001AAD43B7|nr:primosomal replication protein PriC [Spirabiliibacterium falconis]MBE2893705.1 primosomal replication protein [Spirabiliibacterium falconis]